MSDNEEDYDYNDEDDTYEWNEDMNENDDEYSAVADTTQGLKFEGRLLDHLSIPSKGAVYSVYKQLSEICMVDVNESFYSALLTIKVRDQFILCEIEFPSVEPLFPNSPPRIELQSIFKSPNDKFNIIFNCNPMLLPNKWNICTDIVQIIRDIMEVAKTASVDIVDDDPKLINKRIIEIIKLNAIDISGLFPNEQFFNLPSFGITKNKVDSNKKFKGTGYSQGTAATWDFSKFHSTKFEKLEDLAKDIVERYRTHGDLQNWILDAVYFLCNEFVSPTITLDEFFRNIEFYGRVIRSLHEMPAPSEHIQTPIVGLLKLHETFQTSQIVDTLEPHEKELVSKLQVIYSRFQSHLQLFRKKRQHEDDTENGTINSNNSDNRSDENPVHKSNNGVVVDAASAAATTPVKDGTISMETTPSNNNLKLINGTSHAGDHEHEIQKIIEMEEKFKHHIFMKEMDSTVKLPAKWFKRLRIELNSMTESLPDNVLVFTGINVSQPNLMKLILFPESVDTPYCGGAFEFDVFIPANYPDVPPKVLLITTGYGKVRFNPNLYHCGKVCLSLLGTWQGEPWNPAVSSLSQVINSILFLIFVEEPYFNEPGYQNSQGTPHGNEASKKYNHVIQQGTLDWAYYDQFKQSQVSTSTTYQLRQWILPILKENWYTKGKKTALKWAEDNPYHLNNVINSIDNIVKEV